MTQFFENIYQGEQKVGGPGNVGLQLFAQLQKKSGEIKNCTMKKQTKMKNGVNFFSALTHVD